MTITFDAIGIPLVVTVMALSWAMWLGILNQNGRTIEPRFALWSLAIAWPGCIVLASWLVWAVLT